MRRLTFALLLLVIVVSIVGATGRPALGQEGPLDVAEHRRSDVLLARSASGVEAWKYGETAWQQLPDGPAWSDAAGWDAPQYYSTIQAADIDGDYADELLARSASGIEAWAFDGSGWQRLPNGPGWSDAAGWNGPEYYSTIQTGDIDGDGRAELLARGAGGMVGWEFEDGAWRQLPSGPAWSDAAGWNAPAYYGTIQTADVDGDGRDELLARGAGGMVGWELEAGAWQQLPNGPAWSDAAGWNAPEYYSTIQAANLDASESDGDVAEELLARGAGGIVAWELEGGAWQQLPDGPGWSDAGGWNEPAYYSTIHTNDFSGQTWLIARSASGVEMWELFDGAWRWAAGGPEWSDATGWHAPEYYSTIQSSDVDDDGWAELLARGSSGMEIWQTTMGQLEVGPPWSDAAGWNQPQYYSTIQTADILGLPHVFLPTIQTP